MNSFLQDLRYALRSLRKNPGFTLVAVLTLALGIGANTTIFSVVHAVLLRPLPYRDPERLVTLWQNNGKAGVTRDDVSPANFLDWREQSRSFESMAGIEPFGLSLSDQGEPERFSAFLVTAGFFEVLGMNPLYGRWFAPEEYQPGNDHVVAIGYGLWRRRFGGDTGLIGQTLRLNGQPYRVVGIMAPEFQFPLEREVWAPRPIREHDRQLRGPTYWNVVGRLKPGVSARQAQDEMGAIAGTLARQYPETNGGMGVTVVPLAELLTGESRPALLLLLGAVFLLLMIACANVANLLLVRAAERQREFAIRRALGARRGRLVRQLFTEGVVLAALGGLAGLLLSRWGLSLVLGFPSARMPRLEQVGLDAGVLLFALGASLLTALFFGLAPAAQLARMERPSTGERGVIPGKAGPARHRLRHGLVICEVALALVLLTGAGLLLRSFAKLLSVDPGFAKERVLALQVFLGRNQNAEQMTGFFDQALERVAAVPGVRNAAVVSSPPFIGLEQDTPFTIEGRRPPPPGQEPSAYYTEVSADYLAALGVPLRRGRFITKLDRSGAISVVVINDTMARRAFPTQDPVGMKLTVMHDPPVTRQIVGVIGDVLHKGLDSLPRPEMFVPYPQSPTPQMTFLVKTTADPAGMLPAVKASIREVNRLQTFAKEVTMEQLVADSLERKRFNLFLLGSFAGLALALAGIGIYGMVSYATRQRTREIGVRIALGAQAEDVLRLLVGQGMALAGTGVAIGMIGALALTRLMRSLLFGVGAADPLTFAVIAGLMASFALLACWIPARRATRVDPVEALRSE